MLAIIFDFDGVIVDSERHWSVCEHAAFSALLQTWKEGDVHKLKGRSVFDTYTYLVEEYGLTLSKEQYLQETDRIADRVYDKATIVEGIAAFLHKCDDANFRIAIGSSSKKIWIDHSLKKNGIDAPFEHIVTSEELPLGKGKPEPDIYLLVAEKMGVDPEECIVIEDASAGVEAAKRAGMYCIGFRSDPENMQNLSKADREITDLAEIDLASLRNWNPPFMPEITPDESAL